MSRPTVSVGLLLLLGVVAWAAFGLSGRAKDDPVAPLVYARERARALRDSLDKPITVEFDPGPLKDALAYLQDRYNVLIRLDKAAFKEAGKEDIAGAQAGLEKVVGLRLRTVLRLLLGQVQADYLEQDGCVVVVPRSRLTASALFGQSIDAAFEKTALADALQELAALSGVSVVLDPGAGEQARAPVTATLSHVSLESAVRAVATMSGLKVAVIDKILYVANPQKAAELTAEQTAREKPMPRADTTESEK